MVLAGVLFAGSCSEDTPILEPIPLPDGESDALGKLPAQAAGFAVSRGAAPGYVPDAACKECHESLFESYRSVGMSRSFYKLTKETLVEDLGATFVQKATGFHYEMRERDGRYRMVRYCVDGDGLRFAQHEAEVAWVIGSGHHARTYVAQTKWGEMYEMPVTWYAGKGFRMSPGFESAGHDRFERQIKRGCMFCHNAYPEIPVGEDLPGRPHRFPHEMPHGIGCQRCHGPGARHVEAAADEDSTTEHVQQSIVNPASLSPERSEEVCMACHLQPDVGTGAESINFVFDRPMFSHRPDRSILDYVVYFDFGTPTVRAAKIEVNHHGHRMRQSRCYKAAPGRLGCVTCHDPHRKIPEPERAAFYRAKCLGCHQLTDCKLEGMGTKHDPAAADCVACHMVKARPRDVVQVLVTDHKIRRPPAADPTAPATRPKLVPAPSRSETVAYFPARGPQGAILDLHAELARSERSTLRDAPALRAALRAADPKFPGAWLRTARALSRIGDPRGAIEILRKARRRFPADAALMRELAMTLHREGEHGESRKLVDAALAIEDHPRARELLGNLHVVAGRLEAARVAFEGALELRPVHATTWLRYANVLAGLGRDAEAVHAFEQCIARNPDQADAYVRAFEIHARLGRPAVALRVLTQGASRLFELRLELVRQRVAGPSSVRDNTAALRLARLAVQVKPRDGRAHLYLAFVQTVVRRFEAARESLENARKGGADAACCLGLEMMRAHGERQTSKLPELMRRCDDALRSPGDEKLRETIRSILAAMPKGR